MREISFRAWDKMKHKMDDVRVIDWNNQMVDLFYPEIEKNWCGNDDESEVILMQYTGMIDKNGKKIFEGDILRGEYKYIDIDGISKMIVGIGVVKFDEKLGCFVVDESEERINSLADWLEFENDWLEDDWLEDDWSEDDLLEEEACFEVCIVGNIYENPELLRSENVGT